VARSEARPAPSSAPEWRTAGGRPAAHRQDGPSRDVRQLLALAFSVAWIACPLIEPTPDGPEPDYQLWLLPVDLAALATIVAAVTALMPGSRHAGLLGVATGVLMAVDTWCARASGTT
jgi:hypothetical protein